MSVSNPKRQPCDRHLADAEMAIALNNMPAIMRLNSGMRDVIHSDCKGAGFRGRVRRAGADVSGGYGGIFNALVFSTFLRCRVESLPRNRLFVE